MKWIFFLLTPFFLIASPLEELIQLFQIPQGESVEQLWLQQGKERWQFENRFEELRPQVWPLFQEMGMVDEIKPSREHYETAIVLGALLSRVQTRVDYLIETGVTFDQLVFLGGDRPLLDSEKAKLPGLQTEAEMIRWVYDHSDLPKEIPVLFIEVPMNGARRPTTRDTIEAWLETMPHPVTCLAISNQPYVHYQGAVFNRLCTNYLKNREFAKEVPQNFCLERATIAGRQGASEDKNSGVKPMPPGVPEERLVLWGKVLAKTDSSSSLCIVPFSVETVGCAVIGNPTVDLMLDTLARERIYQHGSIEWLR